MGHPSPLLPDIRKFLLGNPKATAGVRRGEEIIGIIRCKFNVILRVEWVMVGGGGCSSPPNRPFTAASAAAVVVVVPVAIP